MALQEPVADYAREIRLTQASIAVTLIAWVAATLDTTEVLLRRWHGGDVGGSIEQVLFITIIQALIWGNFVYQFARLGYLHRRLAHRPLSHDERERFDERKAPSLA